MNANSRRGLGSGCALMAGFVGVLLALAAALAFWLLQNYNGLQRKDEAVTSAWSEVVNQYQRRADLVPNLVQTVKGYAAHEEAVFTRVTAARSKIGSVQINADGLDAAALQRYQAAQGELGSALSRLLAVAENYPDLKASEVFQNLQVQLEGTENRIATARNRYIENVRLFNTAVRQFPGSFVARFAGLELKANFSVENETEISTAPTVSF